MSHLGDTNKMVDTPRTDAAWKTLHTIYELAGEMKRMERELNAANQIAKKYEDRYFAALDRIKRLEEAGDEIIWAFCPASVSMMTERESDALKLWNKAKEAKP